jgi:hypothetical protein
LAGIGEELLDVNPERGSNRLALGATPETVRDQISGVPGFEIR